jgi:hypothetical protein
MGFIEHITVRKIMVKKSKLSVKVGPKAPVEEEPITSVKELNIPSVEGGGIIDFYYLFGGIGVLLGIIFIIVGLLRYVFHIL